jgi:hypothetical protein
MNMLFCPVGVLALLLVAETPHPQQKAGGAPAMQHLADLMAVAKAVGEVPAWENKYVRVYYEVLEYPVAERRVSESRPVVLYVRVAPAPRVVDTRLLEAPQGVRPLWRPGVLPRGLRIELLTPPPAPSRLGEPGTDPPREAVEEEHERYRVILTAFRPFDHGVGAGRLPSVTVFLSEGVVDVSSRGTRRRMGVQAGDAFWFGGGTGPLVPTTGCVMLTSRQRNAPTKFVVSVIYKAYISEPFKMPFKKNGESVYRIVLKALADLTRNAGDRCGYYRWEK